MKLSKIILFIVLVTSVNAFGAVYKCTMPDGKVVYNQTPCQDSSENKELKIQTTPDEEKLAAKRQMEIIGKGDANPPDLKALIDAKKRFEDAHELATSTPRVSLAGPIARMQDIRQATERQSIAGCYQKAQRALVVWMNILLEQMTEFMAGSGIIADIHAHGRQREAKNQENYFWLSIPIECNGQ